MNIQEYFSLKIHQDDLAAPTQKTFCLPCRVQRNLFTPPPDKKILTAAGKDGGEGGGGNYTKKNSTVVVADREEGGEERSGGRPGSGDTKL